MSAFRSLYNAMAAVVLGLMFLAFAWVLWKDVTVMIDLWQAGRHSFGRFLFWFFLFFQVVLGLGVIFLPDDSGGAGMRDFSTGRKENDDDAYDAYYEAERHRQLEMERYLHQPPSSGPDW